MDATCTPADIAYPQDLNLLNNCRKKLEQMIDVLHRSGEEKKPRTYRNKAKRQYSSVAKKRKNKGKALRQAIRQQLEHIGRDIKYVDKYLDEGRILPASLLNLLVTIRTVYTQQKEMYDNKKQRVDNRIVSLFQPHVRPIVRGKASAKTEFGAKLEISVIDGYVRMEELSWDAYNESATLIPAIERYKERTGYYPERVLVDQIYRNRANRDYCKKNGVRMSGPPLGRPPKNQTVNKKIEYQDSCDRNSVEGKFGEAKRGYGMSKIMSKLSQTSEVTIQLYLIMMNLSQQLRECSQS